MKTKKPISLRFNENDLKLAKNKSGMKTAQQLIDFLLSEYVQEFKQKPPTFKAGKVSPFEPEALTHKEVSIKKDATPIKPSVSKSVEPIDKKWAVGRIKELEDQLKSPPKNPIVGLSVWKRVRETEIDKLKEQLK